MALPSTPAQADVIDTLLGKAPGEFVCNSAGTLCAENLRNGAAFDIEASPISHSANGRVAIVVQGGDRNFISAAFAAAQTLSHGGIETRFVLQPDSDRDPGTGSIRVYSNGLPYVEVMNVANPRDQAEFAGLRDGIARDGRAAARKMRDEEAPTR